MNTRHPTMDTRHKAADIIPQGTRHETPHHIKENRHETPDTRQNTGDKRHIFITHKTPNKRPKT